MYNICNMLKKIAPIIILSLMNFIHAKSQYDKENPMQTAVSYQVGTSTIRSSYIDQAILIGFKSSEDELLIGPVYRKYLVNLNEHKTGQIGIRIFSQINLTNYISAFVEGEIMAGNFLKFPDNKELSKGYVSKVINPNGAFGVSFPINEKISLMSGFKFEDYDPIQYFKSNKTPYNKPAFIFRLAYNFIK